MILEVIDIEEITSDFCTIVEILNENLNDIIKVYNNKEYEYWVGITKQDPPFKDAEWEEILFNIEDPSSPIMTLVLYANNSEYIDIEFPFGNLANLKENLDFDIGLINKRKENAAEARRKMLLEDETIDKHNRRKLYEKLKAEFEQEDTSS